MGFDFGGIGSSKSATTNHTNSSGFSDLRDTSLNSLQGVTVGSGKNSNTNFSILDGGAIKGAFALGQDSLDFASHASSQAYDFSTDLVNKTSGQISDAITAVSESSRSETENILINLQKYGLYAFLVWGAVQVFRGFK